MSATSVQLLQAAIDVAGSPRALAARLAVDELLLDAYMADRRELPDHLLLRAVDIVLADRHSRAPRAAPTDLRGTTYCPHAELVCLRALNALPADEAAAADGHVASCRPCQAELAALKPVLEALAYWAGAHAAPPASLREQLMARVAAGETAPGVSECL